MAWAAYGQGDLSKIGSSVAPRWTIVSTRLHVLTHLEWLCEALHRNRHDLVWPSCVSAWRRVHAFTFRVCNALGHRLTKLIATQFVKRLTLAERIRLGASVLRCSKGLPAGPLTRSLRHTETGWFRRHAGPFSNFLRSIEKCDLIVQSARTPAVIQRYTLRYSRHPVGRRPVRSNFTAGERGLLAQTRSGDQCRARLDRFPRCQVASLRRRLGGR